MYKILVFTIVISFFYGCDNSEFDVGEYESQIVVDGWIEQDRPCVVFLTKSMPYFSEVDSASLRDYALTTAKVTVSDGQTSEVLTLKPNYDFFPPYYYTSTKIYGEIGKTYYLTVSSYGQTVTAKTTIPEPVHMDSVWFELEEGKDSLGFLHLSFTDNDKVKNYYRLLSKTIGKDNRYVPVFTPNFNDEYFNGQPVNISVMKGSSSMLIEDDIYYHLGDTIFLKVTTIDIDSYKFWETFEKEMKNTGNPFASSNLRVKTNIDNGLGIWCGYGAVYYEVIAK